MKSKADLIQSKMLNDLSIAEEEEFSRLLLNDASFAKEYEMVSHLSNYLKDDSLMEFREKVKTTGQSFNKPKKIFVLRRYWKYTASVAAVGIIMFGLYFLVQLNERNNQLFNDYYQLDEVYMNTRSGESASADVLEQGLLLFENDKYQESISYFEQLPNSVTAIYYSGVAHMEIDEYEVAEFKFDQVIDNYVNVFYDQALWYKGLCMLKENKTDGALEIFNKISASDSYYKKQADDLIKDFEK